MKKLILSYDYELFFGVKSGTVENTLIIPTNMLLDDMDANGLVGSFFVDWHMLKYLKEENTDRTNSDYKLIVDQLKDIVRRGHRIELHIHPHWVDAKYNGDGTWDYTNYSHYSLDSFSEGQIIQMFVEGKDLLTTIAKEVDPNYEICAFRAGGWAVQPFDKLKNSFLKTNIKIDSSVSYAQHYKCKYSHFDFRSDFLKNLDTYRFSNDVLVPADDGQVIEVPISTFNRGLLHMIVDKTYDILTGKRKNITDGTHKRPDLLPPKRTSNAMMSLSKRSPLSVLLSVIFSRHKLITMIDHPKDYSLSNKCSLRWVSSFVNSITYFDLVK